MDKVGTVEFGRSLHRIDRAELFSAFADVNPLQIANPKFAELEAVLRL